jgi:signal transduction histidine kinase
VQSTWFGYFFALLSTLITSALLLAFLPGRAANQSAIFAMPVLITASLYGRGPALVASVVAFAGFDWLFAAGPPLDPARWPTLLVLLIVGLIAGQLAATLHQQAKAAKQREREALALYGMAKLVPASTLELEPLRRVILDQLKAIVDYDVAAIVRHDIYVEYLGPLPRDRVVGRTVQQGTRMAALLEQVARQREPVILLHSNPPTLDSHDGAQTELAVPLIVNGQVIGVQLLVRSAAVPYSQREGELAMVFAQQATLAIENARLYGEASSRLNEIVGLQQLGTTLLEEHDFDHLLEAIGAQLRDLLDADGVALALLGEEATFFEVRKALGLDAAHESSVGGRMAVEGSYAGEAIRTDHPVRSEDALHDPRGLRPSLVLGDVRSILSVPMRTPQQVIGAISIYNKRGASGFSDRDAELATLFAQQAAVAIENARLYEQARGKAALEERQRLARELHDSVSQALYGIVLNASAAEELFDAKPERARGLLGDVLRLADAGLTEMRALIFELRPESLEQEGLVGALEKHAASVQARHGLQVRLDASTEPVLPVPTKEALYRVAQEALHNTVKHARARTLNIVLQTVDDEVRLTIADDGRGFNPGEAFPGHLGLRSMRERMENLGGHVEIDSAPGAGTRLTAHAPLG